MRPRHVYVHVPFCARRCTYCDFAIAVRARVPVDEYLSALRAELEMRWPVGETWEVDTLYFGGGTPSLLGAEGVASMIDLLRGHLRLAAGAEVTLEANPDDIDERAAAAWRASGVNRLSIGSQSFDDRALAWMHRTHGAARIADAVAAARAGGIENLSLDLIFSLPESLERDWADDLRRALVLRPDHLSLYGLTIEPGTALGRWRDRGQAIEAPEERYEAEYLRAHDTLAAAGFEHYEVSNFARPGRRSRHNASYWSGVPYAGLGPSAHEFDGLVRRWNVAPYAEWLRALADGRDPRGGSEELAPENRMAEEVYLGLRTLTGLELGDEEPPRVTPWVAAGWGTLDGRRLRLSPRGWLRLDSLAADLTSFRSRY
jgi:oxygen-independent coproporphyrinogen-3 oxidase